KIDQSSHEIEEAVPGVVQLPVEPRQLVVLAVGVIVALLRVSDFVAREQHRNSLRQDQRGQQIALLPLAQGQDGLIVGWPVDAAVPAIVVAAAVAVLLAVGLVVLAIVADEIVESESIMAGDEVDAGVRETAALLIQVAAAAEA